MENHRFFKGARVLITGDTGFKGSWLSLWLHSLGARVWGYALPPPGKDALFRLLDLGKKIRHLDGDIRDLGPLRALFRRARPEFVFHLAAQPLVSVSFRDPKMTFDTNLGGAVNILEAVRGTPSVRSLVFVTSDKCYRNREWVWGYRESDELGGADPYSASKAGAELVFAAYARSFFEGRKNLGAATARAGNVIGGGDWAKDRIVPDLVRALRGRAPIRLRHPASTRPWQHVLEPLNGYLLLARKLRERPETFSGSWNFGPADKSVHTVRDLVEGFLSRWGGPGARVLAGKGAGHEAGLLHLNCDKARQFLGWKPRWSFAKTVEETVLWYREVLAGATPAAVTLDQIQRFSNSDK